MIGAAIATGLLAATPALAQSDLDALDLKSAPEEKVAAPAPLKLFVEGAAGVASQRYASGSRGLTRASLDVIWNGRLSPNWRAVLSNRFDLTDPSEPGKDSGLNSLREAYAGWQDAAGGLSIDVGRINLRHGPAYGYNPTDFFKDGALRAVTTLNPQALRENRLGSVMLRGQRLWTGGSLAFALSPKLASTPSPETFSADLGSTNHRHRGLVTLNTQFSDRASAQFLLLGTQGERVRAGTSGTALIGDATVLHGEWTIGKERSLLARALGLPEREKQGSRFAGGLTYTTATKLSVTLEYQYNAFGLDDAGWQRLAARGPQAIGTYLYDVNRRQDLAARRAWFVYLTQPQLGLKNLDLSAFLRHSVEDHSRLGWVELRYHWPTIDAALQWQQYSGRAGSEYGSSPYRRAVQLVVASYF